MTVNRRLPYRPTPREYVARKAARNYVATLLLDAGEHADAFNDEELTEAERAVARDEVKRLGIELTQRDKCEL